MSDRTERPLPEDLVVVADRLREERPTLDGLALDRVKARTRARVVPLQRRAVTRPRGALLKSRLAITMILALGILMSLSGAGLAVSGLGSDGGASQVQYSDSGGGDSSDDGSDSNGGGGNSGGSGGSNTLGGSGDSADNPGDVQAVDQTASDGGGTLPFTGFAAIPLLVGGVALLGSGATLRRRSRDED